MEYAKNTRSLHAMMQRKHMPMQTAATDETLTEFVSGKKKKKIKKRIGFCICVLLIVIVSSACRSKKVPQPRKVCTSFKLRLILKGRKTNSTAL